MQAEVVAPKAKKSPVRLDIQGLRMLAVGSVIADHVFGKPVGGFIGVDVFFVISGFLIVGLLLREFDRSGPISLVDFYRRRIKRLLPASITVLAVTVAASAVIAPLTRALMTAKDAAFAGIFMANWRFASTGTDYFQQGTGDSPLLHFWSLSVEEQFYLVWPALMLLFIWLGRRRPWAVFWLVFGAMSAIVVGSLLWAQHETSANPTVAYFSTLTRAWQLGAGALLAILMSRMPWRPGPVLGTLLAYVGVAGIVASWFVISPDLGFPFPWAAMPTVATLLVLFGGSGGGRGYDLALYPLTNPVARYLGDISFSLYLWHYPVAILAIRFLATDDWRYGPIVLGLTLLLSVLSYHCIEEPFRRSKLLTREWRWTRRRRLARSFVTAGAIALAIVTAVGLLWPRHTVTIDQVAEHRDCVGAAYLVNGCTPDELTGQLTPASDVMHNDIGGGFNCWKDSDEPFNATCMQDEAAAPAKPIRVLVAGDSHAAMYMDALRAIGQERGWVIDEYVGYGCQWNIANEQPECGDQVRELQQRVTDPAERYDIVITAARSTVGSDYPDRWRAGFAEAIRGAEEAGSKVLVLEGMPQIQSWAVECAQRIGFSGQDGRCTVPPEAAYSLPDTLVQAAEQEGAQVIRTLDLLCTDAGCPMAVGGVMTFRDSFSHLTNTYIQTMKPYLAERIDAALAEGR